jgi:hypothetical protein
LGFLFSALSSDQSKGLQKNLAGLTRRRPKKEKKMELTSGPLSDNLKKTSMSKLGKPYLPAHPCMRSK